MVRDDEAYQKIVSMSDHGTKALDDLTENLAALKRTWPLSRYFDDKGFYDRERVLFQPGSERDSRTLRADDLFEPGRSVLTEGGRKRLDEVATWFAKTKRPKSEVVIAAFTDDGRDPDLAQILTQEQAEAVRKYLVAKHKIDASGWFASRKVAAVGFGSQPPRAGSKRTPLPGGSRSSCSRPRRDTIGGRSMRCPGPAGGLTILDFVGWSPGVVRVLAGPGISRGPPARRTRRSGP